MVRRRRVKDQMDSTSIEIFVDEADGVEGVGLILKAASVIEHEGELVPCCKMTSHQARYLAQGLNACAERIETGE